MSNKKSPKKLIFGEGAVHPPFLGSLWMSDDGESMEASAERYLKAMEAMGLVFPK